MPSSNKGTTTIRLGSRSMWCEACEYTTTSVWTVNRIYKSGKEVTRSKCSECGRIEEIEFFSGPKTRIREDV